jgi:NADH-quinone oxidoreductase subunit M
MIAHGFVVVGLFFISEIIFEDMKRELLKWVVFVHNHHQNLLRCSCFSFSISCITYYLTSLESLPYYIAFLKLIWFAFLGGTTIILGALYVENVPTSNVGETNTKVFLLM